VYALREAVTHALEDEVRQIQHVANRTAAYRFFRRKSCPRPWRRLYLLIGSDADYAAAAARAAGSSGDGDSDAGAEGAAATPNPLAVPADTVRRVRRRLNLIDLDNKPGLQPMVLRPIAMRDVPADKICVICQEGYAPEQVLIRTTCNHDFHFGCIMKQWANETWKRFGCALCRHSAVPPGAALGIDVPADEVSHGDVRWLRADYRLLLEWMEQHPGEPLNRQQKALRMAYWRRFMHNRDKRSLIGFAGLPYNWQPLPLFQMYEEEGLPSPPHPLYNYIVDLDCFVPEEPDQEPPMFRFRLRANGEPS
jgi:hypothetical protein